MASALKRSAIQVGDWLRYNPLIRNLLGRYKLLSELVKRRAGDQEIARSITNLCAAARLTRDRNKEYRIQQRLVQLVQQLDPSQIDWDEFVDDFDHPQLDKAAILKPSSGSNEKGVIFISFENEWLTLLQHVDIKSFADRYVLIVSPSWSPHHLVNYVLPAAYPGPVFALISNRHDLEVLPRVSPKFVVVPLYASSWVNPEAFQPRPREERDIDLLMVAGFAKFKRHHALFAALRQMPKDLRVVLVGQEHGERNAESIRAEADCYGVADRFEIFSNQSYKNVCDFFCRAKASVILSRREGSCVVVTESMFADTPVGVLRDAELGSRAFINERTGRFLDESRLAAQLTELVRQTDHYSPRAWAVANISCHQSSQQLNEIVERHMLSTGQRWTRDLATLHWCPDPRLLQAEDQEWEKQERQEILERFGIGIGLPAPKSEVSAVN